MKKRDPRPYLFSLSGLVVGSLTSFLLRPEVFPGKKLPFSVIVSRGSTLQYADRLFMPAAQDQFNYLILGGLLGTAVGVGLAIALRKNKAGAVG